MNNISNTYKDRELPKLISEIDKIIESKHKLKRDKDNKINNLNLGLNEKELNTIKEIYISEEIDECLQVNKLHNILIVFNIVCLVTNLICGNFGLTIIMIITLRMSIKTKLRNRKEIEKLKSKRKQL